MIWGVANRGRTDYLPRAPCAAGSHQTDTNWQKNSQPSSISPFMHRAVQGQAFSQLIELFAVLPEWVRICNRVRWRHLQNVRHTLGPRVECIQVVIVIVIVILIFIVISDPTHATQIELNKKCKYSVHKIVLVGGEETLWNSLSQCCSDTWSAIKSK